MTLSLRCLVVLTLEVNVTLARLMCGRDWLLDFPEYRTFIMETIVIGFAVTEVVQSGHLPERPPPA